MCVMGPCHTDGVPVNAESSVLPSLIFIPTHVWHIENKLQIMIPFKGMEVSRGLLEWRGLLQKMSVPQVPQAAGRWESQPARDLAAAPEHLSGPC